MQSFTNNWTIVAQTTTQLSEIHCRDSNLDLWIPHIIRLLFTPTVKRPILHCICVCDLRLNSSLEKCTYLSP